MQTLSLSAMILGLIIIFAVDTRQKRRRQYNKGLINSRNGDRTSYL